MKKIILLPLLVCLLTACAPIAPVQEKQLPTQATPAQEKQLPTQIAPAQEKKLLTVPDPLISADWPLSGAEKRVTKKPFGLKVSPANSPVQPERFFGYHTGVDYETSVDEATQDVFVSAICDGEILQKRKAQGYGGVVVQSCLFGDQSVTVVYGHLKLTSMSLKVGDTLHSGEQFVILGQAFSTDTGGERKHSHLGIKKGKVVDLLGYVQKESELQGWIDFEQVRKNTQTSKAN